MRVKPKWVTNETWDYDTPTNSRLEEIANDGDTVTCAETEAIAIELRLSRDVLHTAPARKALNVLKQWLNLPARETDE